MKLHHKTFATPRAMLKKSVVSEVVDYVNRCNFTRNLFGELTNEEYGWLVFIAQRIEIMIYTCPDFGGSMSKCLTAYEKLLPQIKKFLQK